MDLTDGHRQLTPAKRSQAPMRHLTPDVPLGGSAFPPIAEYGFSVRQELALARSPWSDWR